MPSDTSNAIRAIRSPALRSPKKERPHRKSEAGSPPHTLSELYAAQITGWPDNAHKSQEAHFLRRLEKWDFDEPLDPTEDNDAALLVAASQGNSLALENLLKHGADPNVDDGAPLRLAVGVRDEGSVRALLRAGANPLVIAPEDEVAYPGGIRNGQSKAEGIQMLLDAAQAQARMLAKSVVPGAAESKLRATKRRTGEGAKPVYVGPDWVDSRAHESSSKILAGEGSRLDAMLVARHHIIPVLFSTDNYTIDSLEFGMSPFPGWTRISARLNGAGNSPEDAELGYIDQAHAETQSVSDLFHERAACVNKTFVCIVRRGLLGPHGDESFVGDEDEYDVGFKEGCSAGDNLMVVSAYGQTGTEDNPNGGGESDWLVSVYVPTTNVGDPSLSQKVFQLGETLVREARVYTAHRAVKELVSVAKGMPDDMLEDAVRLIRHAASGRAPTDDLSSENAIQLFQRLATMMTKESDPTPTVVPRQSSLRAK